MSNGKKQLKELVGPFWPILKRLLAGVTVKFYPETGKLIIARGEETVAVDFADIERAFNESE